MGKKSRVTVFLASDFDDTCESWRLVGSPLTVAHVGVALAVPVSVLVSAVVVAALAVALVRAVLAMAVAVHQGYV